MKKFAILMCMVFMVTIFGACGDAEQPKDNKSETNTNETAAPEATADEANPEDDAKEGEIDERDDGIVSELPFEDELDFYFSSGAGGWGTELYLNNDGTFSGDYHDSEMGSTGEGYPNGTYYIALFEGKFTDFKKIDENTYSMRLESIEYEHEPEEEWIEDEVLYIASTAYGIDPGDEFIFYLPETPTEDLSEEFLSWWPGRYEEEAPETLEEYGICNKNDEYGFFTYTYED